MKQLDLFAGIGGISLAAEWAGIETVAFCEKEPFAKSILRRRFPGRPIYDDVYALTQEVLENDGIHEIDIVAGGFPCQPFSHAGKRTGTADNRYLWPEMLRIIGGVRPTWIFAENVDGLVSMAQSGGGDLVMEDETTICAETEMVLETIRKDLKTIGYQSVPVVIPACGVGASHRRYRIFILGYTERIGCRREPWGRSGAQLTYRHLGRKKGSLAVAPSERRRETREHIERSKERTSSSRVMGNSDSIKLQGQQPVWVTTMGRRSTQRQYQGSGDGAEQQRSTKSGLGGNPYEFSDWLDGWGMNPLDALINFITSYPQPALKGQEQFAWEPPRVTTETKNRAARLKALGNAVDPLQALPVLYGIRVIHEFLQKGLR